jgi:hypothetical protein
MTLGLAAAPFLSENRLAEHQAKQVRLPLTTNSSQPIMVQTRRPSLHTARSSV